MPFGSWEFSSVVERLPSMHKALAQSPELH
jgi:hypothetical protein